MKNRLDITWPRLWLWAMAFIGHDGDRRCTCFCLLLPLACFCLLAFVCVGVCAFVCVGVCAVAVAATWRRIGGRWCNVLAGGRASFDSTLTHSLCNMALIEVVVLVASYPTFCLR